MAADEVKREAISVSVAEDVVGEPTLGAEAQIERQRPAPDLAAAAAPDSFVSTSHMIPIRLHRRHGNFPPCAEQLSRPEDGSRADPAVIGIWVDVAAAHDGDDVSADR